MNCKWYGRTWLWYNLKYYLRICVEGLKKIMKNLTQNEWSVGQYLTWHILNTRQQCQVLGHHMLCKEYQLKEMLSISFDADKYHV